MPCAAQPLSSGKTASARAVSVGWIEILADSMATRVRVPPAPRIETLALNDPPRCAVDLSPARLRMGSDPSLWSTPVGIGGVESVRVGQFRIDPEPVVRVTLVLASPATLEARRIDRAIELRLPPAPAGPWGARAYGSYGPSEVEPHDPIEEPRDSVATPLGRFDREERMDSADGAQPGDPAGGAPGTQLDMDEDSAEAARLEEDVDSADLFHPGDLMYPLDSAGPLDPSVPERAVAWLLEKAQAAILDDRPGDAMDHLAKGLRLYGATRGVGALRLLWHLTVPLTNRPAAVSAWPEADRSEAHLVAAETYDHLAQVAFRQQHLAAAQAVVTAWGAAHPPDRAWMRACLNTARVALLDERGQAALEWLERIPGSALDETGARERILLRAEALEGLERWDEAEEELAALAFSGAGPLVATARTRLADLLCLRGEYGEALALYTASLVELEDPEEREWALYRLGICRTEEGDLAGAREAFARLAEEAPRSPWAPLARQRSDILGLALGETVDEP